MSEVIIGKRKTLSDDSDAFSVLKKEQLRVRNLMYDIMDHKKLRSEMKDLKFGTHEWCDETYNIQLTNMCCKYMCLYCYARNGALCHNREQKLEEKSICDEKKVNKKLVSVYDSDGKEIRKRKVVMCFSVHDTYPENVESAVKVFEKIMNNGNCVLMVSKPNLFCIKYICEKLAKYTKPQVLNSSECKITTGYLQFRFTMGTDDEKLMSIWEPSAPKLTERYDCLKFAYEKGFITSISMEPLLSEPYKLIEMVGPYVRDSIWIGDMNFTSIRHLDVEDTALQTLQKTNRNLIEIVTNLRKSKYSELIHWKESVVTLICLKCGQSS